MVIEPAHVGDAPEILALQRLAYQSEAKRYQDPQIPPLTQTLEDLVQSFTVNTVLKAVVAGRIVGSVNGRLDGQGRCLVGRLMVHPDWQGRGIGTRLLLALEEIFPQAASFRLFTGQKSLDNIRLYERLGYRSFRTMEVPGSFAVVFMEKKGRAAEA